MSRKRRALALASSVVAVWLAAGGLGAPAVSAQGAPAEAPATAAAALVRAEAAYEYGDMNQVVEAARFITEGAVPAEPVERAKALRLLGIGLFLTSRSGGAENAFLELLHLRPRARLDPTTTRPDVVAYFDGVRRRYAAAIAESRRAQARGNLVWSFLPPLGQFKNGDFGRGWLILGLEAAAFGGAIATKLMLESGAGEGFVPRDENYDRARGLKTANHVSVGVLAATWLTGVIDGIVRSGREPDEPERSLSFFAVPGAVGLRARF